MGSAAAHPTSFLRAGPSIATAVHTLKDAPHPFWMSDPWCAETVDIAAEFFKRHLGEVVK